MKTGFLFLPVRDIDRARAFYGTTLGLEVAWHEGEHVTAYRLPGTDVELMLQGSDTASPPGIMLVASDAEAFAAAHPGLEVAERYPIPGGKAVEFRDPDGWTLTVLDESDDPASGLDDALEAAFATWCRAWETGEVDPALAHLAPDFVGRYRHGAGAWESGDRTSFEQGMRDAIRKIGPGQARWHREIRTRYALGPDRTAVVSVYEMTAPGVVGRSLTTEEWERTPERYRLVGQISLYPAPSPSEAR